MSLDIRFHCRHVHLSGHRCGSPALRGESFCYFHHATRPPAPRPTFTGSAYEFPPLEDRASLQIAITGVLNQISQGIVDAKTAGLLLYGLQIAQNNLPPHRLTPPPANTVAEVELDHHNKPLAPEQQFQDAPHEKTLEEILLERWEEDKVLQAQDKAEAEAARAEAVARSKAAQIYLRSLDSQQNVLDSQQNIVDPQQNISDPQQNIVDTQQNILNSLQACAPPPDPTHPIPAKPTNQFQQAKAPNLTRPIAPRPPHPFNLIARHQTRVPHPFSLTERVGYRLRQQTTALPQRVTSPGAPGLASETWASSRKSPFPAKDKNGAKCLIALPWQTERASLPRTTKLIPPSTKAKEPPQAEALSYINLCRRSPNLPHTYACSTIGPTRLNFRVRDGNGCDPRGKLTGKLENKAERLLAVVHN